MPLCRNSKPLSSGTEVTETAKGDGRHVRRHQQTLRREDVRNLISRFRSCNGMLAENFWT